MGESPDAFYIVARQEFDFLVSDYGFAPRPFVPVPFPASSVDYDSPAVRISPTWDRGGVEVGIWVNVDTFWIRPASPRSFGLDELLRLVAPGALRDLPGGGHAEFVEASLRPPLAFYAMQLRKHAEPLLRGDVSLCDDMLIARRE
jgi:hypothetical protein